MAVEGKPIAFKSVMAVEGKPIAFNSFMAVEGKPIACSFMAVEGEPIACTICMVFCKGQPLAFERHSGRVVRLPIFCRMMDVFFPKVQEPLSGAGTS